MAFPQCYYGVNPVRTEEYAEDIGYGMMPAEDRRIRPGHSARVRYEQRFGWPADPNKVWADREAQAKAHAAGKKI